MAKKKRKDFAVCGDCMELIDIDNILPLILSGQRVVHECGKNLGKYEASTKS